MARRGESLAYTAVQGAGFAGAYYAAEAFEPLVESDRERFIAIPALGDINPRTKKPATLVTDSPEGLPITHSMVDAVLDPTDHHMRHTGGDKLAALAWKLELAGADVDIVDRDVLDYQPRDPRANNYMAPAATSNVYTPQRVTDSPYNKFIVIGNRVFTADGEKIAVDMGKEIIPGELANAGGVKMSIEENRRDLGRIHAAERQAIYLPTPDSEYDKRLYVTMSGVTNRAYDVSEKLSVPLTTAVQLIALGNYALSRGMQINSSMRNLLTTVAA